MSRFRRRRRPPPGPRVRYNMITCSRGKRPLRRERRTRIMKANSRRGPAHRKLVHDDRTGPADIRLEPAYTCSLSECEYKAI